MNSPLFARTGTLQFGAQNDVENDTMDMQERMNRYLDDQSSISGSDVATLDPETHGDRVFDSLSGFHSVSRGSRRSGSAYVSTPSIRADDCGGPEGCGTEGSLVRFKIDLKPKDPPIFVGKSTDDVEVWAKQVTNFLLLIGGPDHMQVAYLANLL